MPREVDDGQQSTGLWGDRLRSRVAPHAMRFANLQTAHQHIANRDSKELSPEPHDQLDSPFGHIQERPYQPQPVLGAVPESDEGESTISNFIGQYESRRGTPESLVQGNGSSKQARARGPQRPLPPDPPRRANHLDRALVESANAGGNTSDPQSYDTTSRLLADSSIEQGRKAQQHLQRASEAVTINSETFSDPSLEGIAGRDRGHVHYVRKSNDFDRSLTWIDPSSTAEDQPHTSARPSLERNPNNPYNNSTRTSGESSSAWTDDHSERSPFDLGDSFEAATRRQQREAEERIDEQEEEYEENGTGHDDEWITVAESSQNVTGSMNHTSALRSPRSNRNLPGLDISHSHLTRPSQVIDEADELDLPQAMPSPLRKALTRESLQSPLQRLKSELSRMSTTSKRKSGSSSLSLSNPPTPQRSMRRKPTFTEEFDDEDYDNIELQNMSHISRPAAAPGQPHFGERNISQHPRETRFGTVNMAQPSVNPALAGRLREADPRQPSTPLSASNTFARVTPMGAYGNITGSPGGTNMKATGSSVVDTTNTLRHARTHSDARREAMEHLEGLKRDGSEEDAEMEQQRIQSSGEGPGQTFLHKMGIVPVKNKNSRSRLTIPDNYTINADGTMSLGALTHNDESHPDLVNTMGHEGQRTSSSRNLIDRDLAQLEAQRLRPHPNLVSSEEARSQQLGWSIIFLIGCHLFPPSLLLYGHGTLDTIMPYLTNRKVGEMNPSLKKYARLFGIAWTVVSIFVVVGVVVAYVLWRHGRHH
ncbi:MAG: hypothetical protein M1831_003491 [Alyxoria varia]|nr:MAG: hypothetical protein M1831_003491 [Alyxoria varia]